MYSKRERKIKSWSHKTFLTTNKRVSTHCSSNYFLCRFKIQLKSLTEKLTFVFKWKIFLENSVMFCDLIYFNYRKVCCVIIAT